MIAYLDGTLIRKATKRLQILEGSEKKKGFPHMGFSLYSPPTIDGVSMQ